MRRLCVLFVATLFVVSCGLWKQNKPPALVESQRPLVAGCQMLGLLSETADAGNPSSLYARHRMIKKIRSQALQLGGTHIVWLHKNDHAAAAEVYRCPRQ